MTTKQSSSSSSSSSSKLPSNKTVISSGGLTRETYGKINVSAIESATQLWLAQLPATLATAIDAAPEGTYLGTLTFTKGGLVATTTTEASSVTTSTSYQAHRRPSTQRVTQSLSLQISPSVEETLYPKIANKNTLPTSKVGNPGIVVMDVLPFDYTLKHITKQSAECVMHPFTRHPTNGSIELHGSVVRTLTVEMERTERYHEMCKSRIHHHEIQQGGKANVESIDTIHSLAKVDVLQSSNAVKTAAAMGGSGHGGGGNIGVTSAGGGGGGFGHSVAQFGKRLREAQQQQSFMSSSSLSSTTNQPSRKRPLTFTSESSIRTILFELFSQQSHWSLKDIRAVCGGFKTDKEIRTELNLIGEYQRIGPYKGLWELKTEFKGNLTTAMITTVDTTSIMTSTSKDDSTTG